MRLENKVAIVTGAAGGIGLDTVRLFVDEGASVVLVDLPEEALVKEVAIIGSPKASYHVGDVTDPGHVQRIVEDTLLKFGRVDVFVANAGIEGVVQHVIDYPLDRFDEVMNVNARGVFICMQAVLPVMKKQREGSFIITASGAGLRGANNLAGYVASKHAALGLMKVAALDMAKYGVRVNAVTPGPVETRMMRSLEEGAKPGDAKAAYEAGKARIPMGRYALPIEVAKSILFLASDDSSYCSGGTYAVDGANYAR